jgi:hypothetical protein
MVREARMHRPSRPGISAVGDVDAAGGDLPEAWDDPEQRAAWDDLLDCDWLDDLGPDGG